MIHEQDSNTLDSDIDEDEPPPIGRAKQIQKRSKNSTDNFRKRQSKPALPLPIFPKLEKLVQSIVSKPKSGATVPTKSLFMNSPFMNSPFMNGAKLTSHPFLAAHPTEEDSDLSVQDEDSENDEGDDQCEDDGVYYVDKILQKRVNAKVGLQF